MMRSAKTLLTAAILLSPAFPSRAAKIVNGAAPDWVGAGTSLQGDSFLGVGVAGGIRNRAIAVTAADDRARAEVAKLLHEHGGDPDCLKRALRAAFIIDHWKDPSDGTMFSLAKLDSSAVAACGSAHQETAPAAAEPPSAARPAEPPHAASVRSDVDNAPAKPLAERPNDFALVIGIEDYQNVPKADFGERDAAAMKAHLRYLGVPEENIITLTGNRATRTGIAKYVEEWLPRNVEEDSRIYFYYSGHGAPDPADGTAYLVPWDGDPSFLKTSAYPVSRLYKQLGALKARAAIVMLDSCFSGAGGRSVIAKGARPLVNVQKEPAKAPAKVSVLAASAGDEITGSLEAQGHGMFTYYLLKGLDGAADPEHTGHLSLEGLHAYLKKAVTKAAHRDNREQTPQLNASQPKLELY